METVAQTPETFKTIPLTQGQVAIVDAEDYERLSRRNWYAQWCPKTRSYYANTGPQQSQMSRLVCGVTDPKIASITRTTIRLIIEKRIFGLLTPNKMEQTATAPNLCRKAQVKPIQGRELEQACWQVGCVHSRKSRIQASRMLCRRNTSRPSLQRGGS